MTYPDLALVTDRIQQRCKTFNGCALAINTDGDSNRRAPREVGKRAFDVLNARVLDESHCCPKFVPMLVTEVGVQVIAEANRTSGLDNELGHLEIIGRGDYITRILKAPASRETPENLPAEKGRLPDLLSMPLKEYEDRVRPLPKPDLGRMLVYLLEEHGLKPPHLAAVPPEEPGVGDRQA